MWFLTIRTNIRIKLTFMIVWWVYIEKELHGQVLDQSTKYIAEDETFELKCRNETGGIFAQLVWTSNAYAMGAQKTVYAVTNVKKIDIKREFKDRVVIFNETSIRIKNARVGDSGKYECNIIFQYTPKGGFPRLRVRELAVYRVIVVSPPKHLYLSKSSLSIPRFRKAAVYCEVQASSPFNLTWIKINGNFSSDIDITEEQKEASGHFIKRKHLVFNRFSKDDSGRYECHAKNIGGEVSQHIDVRMQTSPMIISKDIFNINVYDTGKLLCKAKGYPLITFIWKFYDKDGSPVELHSTERNGQFSASYNEYNAETEIGTSRLTIEQVQKHDLKIYECIAKNTVGSVTKEIRLSGFAPPDAPVIKKSSIEAHLHKVKLVWTLGDNGGKPITSITIKYKNSSSPKDWTTLQITQSFTEYTVTNLQSSTSYDFKVLATNEIGDSEYSSIVNAATTVAKVPVPKTTTDDDAADFFGKFSPPALIGIFGGAFVALIIGFACICIFVRRMQKRDAEDVAGQHPSIAGTTSVLQHHSVNGNSMEMEPLNRKTDEWEFPRDRLTITTVLGAGAFGVVMRGLSQGIKGSVGQITVAVKTVRDTSNEAATKDLIAELNLLKLIPEHPNVLGLLGCCTRIDPLYVIVEYCANGDLQGFLRSSRGIYERYYKTSYGGAIPDLTSKMLLTFAWQVAKGMAHLSTMKVIHRDLAARNILVDDQLICKVSDFGFARDIYVEDHYLKRSAGGRFPIKWMAIESLLDGISTTKSDVWSFGVVLWELVTLGASPYPGMSSYEVVSFLQDGYRMDKPKHAASEIYALMMDCWSVSPGRRPSFNIIADRFQELVKQSDDAEFINMTFYQDHLYVNFDGTAAGSAAASTSTTPHGTLGRSKDRLNSIQQLPQPLNGLGLSAPRTLRSTSQVSVRSTGRSNSLPGLSERSATATSYRDERVALLPPIPQ